MSEPKLRRGDPHPTKPHLYFRQYDPNATGGIRWAGKEELERVKAQNREYHASKKEERKAYLKEYYRANAEKFKAKSAEWYANNKERAAKVANAYRRKNLEATKARKREHYHRTKGPETKARRRAHYEANRQSYLDRAWAHKRDPEVKQRRNAREQLRKKTDPLFHLATGIRSRISTEVSKRGFSKNSKSAKVLGCDWLTYRTHLEGMFKEGMSWGNRVEWHIDHVVPLVSATTEEELYSLLFYKNTQPLWKDENLRKATKMPE